MLDSNCKGPNAPWWQAFLVYKTLEGRRVVFQWERSPAKVKQVYTSPLLEAKKYAGILKNDPIVKTQADLAREMGVSRVRITQVMNLLKLVPDVQEQLLRLEDQKAIRFFSEHRLRPLVQIQDAKRQVREFQEMLTLAALLKTKADSGTDAHPGGRSDGNTGFARGEPPVARH